MCWKKDSQQGAKQLLNKKCATSCIHMVQKVKGMESCLSKRIPVPLFASKEAIGICGFTGSLIAFWAESDLESCRGSDKEGSAAVGGASSAATDAASMAMERVVILPLRRPWLLAVFLPRGVLCSFPSSSSPPSHLSLSLLISLKYREWQYSFKPPGKESS